MDIVPAVEAFRKMSIGIFKRGVSHLASCGSCGGLGASTLRRAVLYTRRCLVGMHCAGCLAEITLKSVLTNNLMKVVSAEVYYDTLGSSYS
jgi:hypothetical protein